MFFEMNANVDMLTCLKVGAGLATNTYSPFINIFCFKIKFHHIPQKSSIDLVLATTNFDIWGKFIVSVLNMSAKYFDL